MDRRGKIPAAIVYVILGAGFLLAVTPRFLQVQQLRERSHRLEKELREMKTENDRLEQELRLLRDDPVYLEKVARAQFNKAKEGEIVYKVVREGQNTKSS